jgi:hypothetical protein
VTPFRRRGSWLIAVVGLLAVLTYGVARGLDEPVRQYMEREVNRRLTGYTVSIPALRIHPWALSIEFRDATIIQNANPDPPVTHIATLVTRVDWRALLHRRVVADITFDRPTVHLDLRHVRAEAREDVPVSDRGWQEALEALAFDLKINRLQIREGDVTYVDQGPFKPLRLSRLNMSAENIRNIASKERVYPSDISLEGVVFDAGQVWLDGRADFLAEPHPGVEAALRLEGVELDYFTPITNRYNMSVRNGTLSLAGTMEYAPKITRLTLERVLLRGVALEYTHAPHTAAAEKARAEQTAEAAKQVANTPSAELRINRLDVARSTFGFVNRAAAPAYRLAISDTDVVVEHLSNQARDGRATVRLRGQLMGRGETSLTAVLQPQTGSADMDLTARIEGADLTRLSDLVRAYGGFDVRTGEFSVYSELTIKSGVLDGYIKPLFRDLQVGDPDGESPRDIRRRLYEGLVAIAAKILKNRSRDEVATVVHVSGPVERPQISRWATVGRLLQNAFLKPIDPGFEPRRSSPPRSSNDERASDGALIPSDHRVPTATAPTDGTDQAP